MDADDVLESQIEYYRSRAPEYDDWPERRGRYDRGAEHRERWAAEVAEVRRALAASGVGGRVLELACGTGWWTRELVKHAESVDAVDSSAETMALNRAKVGSDKVRYIQADLFAWEPEGTYDSVFFSFWLSHVPPNRFLPFWTKVADCLAPGGMVFFVDSLYNGEYHWTLPDAGAGLDWVAARELSDGRRFEIVKVFYEPDTLEASLAGLGWDASVRRTPSFFLWGEAALADS